MRYAVFSDIHGNLEALNAVLEACRDEGVREYYCVGDLVGYGANPNECINLIQKINAKWVAGNHDWAVIGKMSTEHFNDLAQAAVRWTQQNLDQKYVQFLKDAELVYKQKEFVMVHGSLNNPEAFHYIFDIEQTSDTFYLMEQNLCFIGHTHAAQTYIQNQDNVAYVPDKIFEIKPDCQYIVNVGSVGQPRDGNPQACFAIFDPDLMRVEIKRVYYDVETAQRKIFEAGLPDMLAKRLTIGQ